jgi:tRNA A-37 threonylcarbamoyl transferase component Bud32
MTTPSHPTTCPKCGAILEEGTSHGLCPKCLLAHVSTATPAATSTAAPRHRTSPPSIDELAPHFPDLEIQELIGAGGMGAVYKARQRNLDRLVALKILSADLAQDPAFAERFNREARVLARLNHPHIVTIFDYGIRGPYSYLVMEFVDGMNLRQAMRVGTFTPADALALVKDVCCALEYAHQEGVLHRDIKPENILIDARGRVKVADFGIAKLTGAIGKDDYTLTFPGVAIGSPHYMAPEQFESPGDVDQRADIYSLGVLFYELLTRELPIGRFAPPSSRAPMDPRIDEIVMRALEKDRQARYQDASEVKTGVSAIGNPGAPQPPASGSPSAPVPPAPPAATLSAPSQRPAPPIRWKAALIFAIVSLLFAIPGLLLIDEPGESDIGLGLLLVGVLPSIGSVVYWAILHHQCWMAIPERFRSLSPGRAVGFLFIPFFNLYWAFITWPKLAEDVASWQRSLGNPRPTQVHGLGVTYGILFVLSWTFAFFSNGLAVFIGIAALVIFILFYRAVVNAINCANGHR